MPVLAQSQNLIARCFPPLSDTEVHAIGSGKGKVLPAGAHLEDFYAYMPMHKYIFAPSREMWPACSVNARIPPITGEDGKQICASAWLDSHRAVEQMTWAPGEPSVIEDRLVSNGGWIARSGCRCFNLYFPSMAVRGDARKAGRWIDHVRFVYPTDADHILKWLAHRVKKPSEKVNHALVLCINGSQYRGNLPGRQTLLPKSKCFAAQVVVSAAFNNDGIVGSPAILPVRPFRDHIRQPFRWHRQSRQAAIDTVSMGWPPDHVAALASPINAGCNLACATCHRLLWNGVEKVQSSAASRA